jgi:hypothetical protein
MNLTKTIITQLINSYIDCSYSDKGNTNVLTIDTPTPQGDLVIQPFTIRTNDGFSLKYNDETGKVSYRIQKKYFATSTTESKLLTEYNTYFSDYELDLQTLATYENTDPVIQFITPTYPEPYGDGTIQVPLFEYNDIEIQKENIFIIDTGIVNKDNKKVFIASYYGANANKCKLDLLVEVVPDPFGGSSSYVIKTQNNKMYNIYHPTMVYNADGFGSGGKKISNIISISSNAEQVGEVIEEDNTDGLFTTYILNHNDLKNITNKGAISSEIIINTFSYPIKFNDDDLLETNIMLGGTPVEDIKGKRFKRPEPKIKIFTFNIPYLKDVESCKLLLPFNPEIILDYDIIRGQIINGYVQYEVSTNSSTLYIDNGDTEFYKDTIIIETSVPFKPTGEYSNFKETEKRLGKQNPTLLIKCLQEETQHHFIQGTIEYPIEGILKDEMNLLNSELQKGVITNE